MNCPAESVSVVLPKTIGAWSRSNEVRRVLPAKIFEYMDGAGELYLGYRFDHLDVSEYSAPGEDRVLVELYWMKSSDDAFGLLSGDWGGEPVDLDKGAPEPGGPTWLPARRALYGAGLLRVWSGNLYARIMAYRETPGSREAVLRLGELVVSRRTKAPAPALIGALPPEEPPGFKLRPDRFTYFRSHLVLNSVYFLSTRDILDLDRTAEAVAASYSPPAAGAGRRSIQLVLVRYATGANAAKALAHFEQAYVPEKQSSTRQAAPGTTGFAQVEDGWLGYGTSGRSLVLVFECPERDLAVQFINDSINRIQGLEARHE